MRSKKARRSAQLKDAKTNKFVAAAVDEEVTVHEGKGVGGVGRQR